MHETFKNLIKRVAQVGLTFALASVTLLFYQNCGKGFTSISESNFSSNASLGSVGGPGTNKIRRLSNVEYRNSISDVVVYQFGRQNKEAVGETIMKSEAMTGKLEILPQDVSSKRLGTDQLAAFLSPSRFTSYVEIANGAADLLTKDASTLSAFAGVCATSNTDISNVACLDSFIKNFAILAFRNPVKSEEVAELKIGIKSWKDLIGRILIHPRFLNRFEREGKLIGGNGVYLLNDFEIEAKLCAVFWKSVPDVKGLEVAASGALSTQAGLRAEIKRILASPKAQATLWIFYQQWLASARVPKNIDFGDPAFIPFAAGVNIADYRTYALEDGKLFLDYITWTSKGKLEDIFRSPLIFTTNPMIASIYGVSPRSNVSAPPITDTTGYYKGILTRPIITAQKPSISGETNHILRGVFLVTNILGIELGNPANFGDQNAAASQVPAGAGTRTEVTVKTSASTCIGCHSIINPSGFAMSHYDSLGRYATVEKRYRTTGYAPPTWELTATNNIDSNTSLFLNGVSYSITGVPSLVDALFKSGRIYDAFSRYYFRFAFGRIENSTDDTALLDSLKINLQNQSIQDVLENMAMHPDFLRVKAAN